MARLLSQSLIAAAASVSTVPEELDTAAAQVLRGDLPCTAAPDPYLTVDPCGTRCCDVAELLQATFHQSVVRHVRRAAVASHLSQQG
jgi:hypothetical protein